MKLQLGEIAIESIVEMEGPFTLPQSMFPACTEEAMAECSPHLAPWALDPASGMLIFKFQSYLVRTPHHTVLIDSCVGCNKTIPRRPEWHKRTDEVWLDRLRAAGVAPEAVDYVFCTHLHPDHCGWNTRMVDGRWVPTFPNARYVVSKPEFDSAEARGGDTFLENVLPIAEAGQMELVALDHAVDDHLWLQPTTGHTPGHVAVSLASQGKRASMCGDLIHSPVQCLRPDWSTGFDADQEAAKVTRRRYLEEQSESGAIVLTAHFPSPSTGRFRRNPGFSAEAFWMDFID